MEEISLEMFGTTDYESILDALAPNDGMALEFKYRTGLLKRPAVANNRRVRLWKDDDFR